MAFSSKTTTATTGSSNAATSVSNVMVTLATAFSTSFPSSGKEGEATLSEQLAELLQDKTLPLTELSLLYCYRFGFSIVEALKSVGFNGKLQDFVEEQKCFSVTSGRVRRHHVDSALVEQTSVPKEEASADKLMTVQKDGSSVYDEESASNADTGSTTDAESCQGDIDLNKWKLLGGRIAAALHADDDEAEDDETTSTADTGISSDAESLHADDEKEEEEEAHRAPDPKAWRNVGCRVAAALKDCQDDCFLDSPDPVAWHNVGCRLTAAFKNSNEDECLQDSADPAAWHNVGYRLTAAFKHVTDVDID